MSGDMVLQETSVGEAEQLAPVIRLLMASTPPFEISLQTAGLAGASHLKWSVQSRNEVDDAEMDAGP
eukprot:5566654-Amphidinium_carterae.1